MIPMLTPERLRAIKERCERATPGPWWWDDRGDVYGSKDGNTWIAGFRRELDAEFAAHARDDVPALVAEVERLWDENRRLKLRLAELLAGAWKDKPELGRQIREDRET